MYLNGGSYKIILTDFNMPVMDGLEASAQIRQFLTDQMSLNRDEQPIIIGVSGQGELQQNIESAGIDIIYTKPLYFEQMQ